MKYADKDFQQALGCLLREIHDWLHNELGYAWPHVLDRRFWGRPCLYCTTLGIDLYKIISFVEKHNPLNLFLTDEGTKALAVLKRYKARKRLDGSPDKVIVPDKEFRKMYHKI